MAIQSGKVMAFTAVSGLVAGLAACGGGQTDANTAPTDGAKPGPEGAGTETAAAAKECCKGKNVCKGKGGCNVEGANTCAGKNECKGKGGCKTGTCAEDAAAPAPAPAP